MISWWMASAAWGFCGSYVGPVDSTPKNGASRIVVVHQDDKTVLTMTSDARNAPPAFGMLMPVPAEVTIDDIEARDDLDAAWGLLDEYTAPRVVSYTCDTLWGGDGFANAAGSGCDGASCTNVEFMAQRGLDALEAQVDVLGIATSGVYEIALLDAAEAAGLQQWLDSNGFGTMPGADALIDDYISQGVNFLAARIVLPQATDEAWLQPLRLTYPYRTYDLPLRLGAVNALGDQQVTVWVIGDADDGETQVLTFPEIEVESDCMPQPEEEVGDTLLDGIDAARGNQSGVSLVEYSWPTQQKCDPCPIGPASDPSTFLGDFGRTDDDAHITRLRLTYDAFDLNDDLHLSSTGQRTQRQLRYIQHLDELEEEFPLCNQGFAATPRGTCDDDEADEASLPWLGLLLIPLLGWQIRRQGAAR